MKKSIGLLLVTACLISGTATAYIRVGSEKISVNKYLPPSQTHMESDGRGGYRWTDSGNPDADNYADRLPSSHSMTPDGRGGFYVR